MARDYAKKGSGRKGAGRGGRKPAPRWLWLVSGLALGLFVAFLVFLSQHQPQPGLKEREAVRDETPAPAKARAKKPEESVTAEAKPPEKKPMNYDFYTRLPEFEVEVPDSKGSLRPRTPAEPGSYVLQAGSFKSAKDADARKAELAMLGIVASVQTVVVEGKPVYHRVRVGPYRDLERLNQARDRLRENNIEFVTLKERS